MTAGKGAVVQSLADASRDLARQQRKRNDPKPASPRGPDGWSAGKWEPNRLGLPKGKPGDDTVCPVVPIGIEGENYYLIDSAGQFRVMTASDFSHAGIQGLFAQTPNYPQWAWPRFGRAPKVEEGEKPKPPPIKSFEDDAVRQALFYACAKEGLFSPTDKMRGRGCWTLRGGEILYHAGEDLWIVEGGRIKALETGLHEAHLYPRMAPLPAPWTEKITPEINPAGELLKIFRKWNWARPEIDPLLLLGWIGVAIYGGALSWRSAVCLIGDKGTGKSTLQDGLKMLFGDLLFHSANTTAAGVYQKMQHDARPVAVDELEPSSDGYDTKTKALTDLMRVAASGSVARRGSASGAENGIEFQLRSAFLFSAINNVLTEPADVSRVAILRLGPNDRAAPIPITQEQYEQMKQTWGRILVGRCLTEWPRFHAVQARFQDALRAGKHEKRGQDTYGTLLACAEILLGPELAEDLNVKLSDDGEWWAEHLSADMLPEVEDALPNWRRCLKWLMASQVEQFRNGHRNTIGKVLEDLERDENRLGPEGYSLNDAKRDLALTGIGLLVPGEVGHFDDGYALAIPNDHPQVRKLFRGTPWMHGGWKDALRQCPVPGVMVTDKKVNRVSIAGEQERCTLVLMGSYRKAPER